MGDYLNSQPPPGAFAQAYGQPQPQQPHQYQNQQQQQPQQQQPYQQQQAMPHQTSAYSSAPPPALPPPQQQLHQHHQQQQTVQHRPISLHAAPPGVPAPPPQQRRLSRNGGGGSGGGGKGGVGSMSKKAMPSLRALNFFGHLDEDFVVRSASGGMITAVAAVVMVLLFFGELSEFLFGERKRRMLFSSLFFKSRKSKKKNSTSRSRSLLLFLASVVPSLFSLSLLAPCLSLFRTKHLADSKSNTRPLKNEQSNKKHNVEKEYYLHGKPTTTLSVDATRSAALDISFDLTFHKLPCSWLTLDAMDVSGTSELDVSHHIHKRRVDPSGHGFLPDDEGGVKRVEIGPSNKPSLLPSDGTPGCGSCYGAGLGPNEVAPSAAANATTADAAGAGATTGSTESKTKPDPPRCCATCDEVRAAYRLKGWKLPDPLTIKQCHDEGHHEEVIQQKGEGCHVWGSLRVAKVAGSFHIAPGYEFFWFSPSFFEFFHREREGGKPAHFPLSFFFSLFFSIQKNIANPGTGPWDTRTTCRLSPETRSTSLTPSTNSASVLLTLGSTLRLTELIIPPRRALLRGQLRAGLGQLRRCSRR